MQLFFGIIFLLFALIPFFSNGGENFVNGHIIFIALGSFMVSRWVSRKYRTYHYFNQQALIQPQYEPLSPIAFEEWCANILQEKGWQTRLSPRSHDYGLDIAAQKGNMLLAVQCKKHHKPVGIKAVQEIHAARDSNGAHLAMVVATNGFTQSAINLASKLNVSLYSPYDLVNFNHR